MLSTRPHSTTKVWARDMVTELWVLASNHTSTRTALLELRHWQLRSKIGATHLSDYLACNYAFNITFDQILKLGPEGLVNSTIVQQPLKIGLMSYEGYCHGIMLVVNILYHFTACKNGEFSIYPSLSKKTICSQYIQVESVNPFLLEILPIFWEPRTKNKDLGSLEQKWSAGCF